jgi:two-component system sensor histidine kinase BaeS
LPVDASATLNPLDVDRALLAASSLPSTQTAEGATVSCGHAQCAHLVAPVTAIDARAKGPFDAVSRMAYAELLERTDGCLRHMGLRPVTTIEADFAVSVDYAGHDNQVATCVESSRKAMLRAYVAPPSLLFVGSGSPEARAFWVLSGRNKLRIVLVASAILAVTFILCALLAAYVVRPLRVMAATAARAADGDLAARVPVSRHDEVGQVAHAFNQMADRREQLEEARRRMVADVSHELRTPLANIGGWIEAAQDGLASRDDELLATLHDETMTLQRLVEDLQQLSLGDVGELRIEPTAIDTSVFVEQLAASMRPGAEAAGITLATDARSGMTLEADPFRLRQAVGNLVANAIRHSAPGGSITIAAGPATISVRDTGEGIPPADLPHVMERFRRSDSSRSRATGGSGLGLAIVRQIVEAHGGHVEIESVPGHGTTVALFFPNP